MIVRISGEDQYELPDDERRARSTSSSTRSIAVVEAGDEAGFTAGLRGAARARPRARRALADDDLVAPT